MAMLDGGRAPPFAPPFLRDGDMVVSHVANILHYLGPKLGLAPADEAQRIFAHGLQLTITDFVAEAHDTHHPIATDLYYEDQKTEAKARAAAFLAHRVPKYFGYFERVLTDNPAGAAHAVGSALTTVDLSLFQIWAGMTYAFPRAFAGAAKRYPKARGARGPSRRPAERRALSCIRAPHSVQRVRAFSGITRSSIRSPALDADDHKRVSPRRPRERPLTLPRICADDWRGRPDQAGDRRTRWRKASNEATRKPRNRSRTSRKAVARPTSNRRARAGSP